MKILLILTIFCFNVHANDYYSYRLYFQEEPESSRLNEGHAIDRTRSALMRFDIVQKRAEYFTRKLKNMTFGEYTEDIMIIAPLLTGELEFNVNDINVFIDHNSERAGFRYRYRF